MIVTVEYIESLIQRAKESNAPISEIDELQEHLDELRSGRLMNQDDSGLVHEEIDSAGNRTVYMSDAPTSFDEDFEGVEYRTVKRKVRPDK